MDPLSASHLTVYNSYLCESHENSWSAHKIIQAIPGIWFAALHRPALPLTYALDDLWQYPEYGKVKARSRVDSHKDLQILLDIGRSYIVD